MRASRDSEITGDVIEALPNGEFRVAYGQNKIIRCYLAGKVKMNRVRVLVGDKVRFVDCGNIGRITWRF